MIYIGKRQVLMRLRRYRNTDFKALAHLYRDFFNEMREWQGWVQLKLSDEEASETAKGSLDKCSRIFVAEDSGKLAGFGRIQLWDGAYFVREIYVAKPCRRKGIGSRLLARCEDQVRKEGETSVYLTVEPRHAVSLSFLIKNGYDTLNMLELRKDFGRADCPERQGSVGILGHRLRLLRRRVN